YLDETIQTLSARIEEMVAPFSKKVDLLKTIPGVDQRTAEVIVAEIGVKSRTKEAIATKKDNIVDLREEHQENCP
ncbi:MAG: hypothetical protein ABR529_01985, partial [Actinomycetota bacterium]